jgi:hypothetical protein
MRSSAWRHLSGPVAIGSMAAAVVTAVLWRGSWGKGLYLYRDFVAVPEPARPDSLLPDTYAALRAWPLDGVMWAMSSVIPTGVQQLLMLLAIPLIAGSGVAAVLRAQGRAAAVVGAVLAAWNPYVAERLLLGQPPTLLAYAVAPWIVVVARSTLAPRARWPLLVIAALPAAVTPWGGLIALGTAVLATLTREDRSWRSVAASGLVGVGWCLPWLVPSVLATGRSSADPDGARAFALADDTGLGTLWSALTGGGVWSSTARLASREDVLSMAASGVLLVAALAGALTLQGRKRWGAVGLLLGPALVTVMLSGPLVEVAAGAQGLPGVALLRDQHRALGLAALAQAVLVGHLLGRMRISGSGGAGVSVSAATAALALTVSAAPDLPGHLTRAYRPVTFPSAWASVVATINSSSDVPTTMVSLPWQPLRLTDWAGDRPFLDPTPRALRPQVLTSSELRVDRDGVTVVVDDHPVVEGQDWSRGELSSHALAAHGVTHVVTWLRTPGAQPKVGSGWRLVDRTDDWVVWDVSGAR